MNKLKHRVAAGLKGQSTPVKFYFAPENAVR